MKTPLGIKIGADPEFLLHRSNGQIEPAYGVFGHCDERQQLNSDGRSDTAELRPTAGSYYEVAHDISKLLSQARKRTRCDAYAGSGTLAPIGGHIHFSGIPSSAELTANLNKYIALPLNSISDTSVRIGRHGYGQTADRGDQSVIRAQPHGWEYRAPLSWLSTPVFTLGALAIAWVLARAYKMGKLDKLNTKHRLLAYCYKREKIAISNYFDSIDDYKANDRILEGVEIFDAWHKTGKPQASLEPQYSNDTGLADIQRYGQEERGRSRCGDRYNPYACFRQVRICGMSSHRATGNAVFLHQRLASMVNGNHIGARVIIQEFGSEYTIGLSATLRRHPQKACWVIKRVIKSINESEV